MTKTVTKSDSVLDMPLAELEKRVAQAKALIEQAQALLPGLRTLTEDDRQHSNGKLREGESAALRKVLDGINLHPAYFTSLADQDEGQDPTKLETDLISDRLARRDVLAQLQPSLAVLDQPVADTVMYLGEQTRPVLLAAYRIARTVAKTDKKLRDIIAPAIDYYSNLVKRQRSGGGEPTPGGSANGGG